MRHRATLILVFVSFTLAVRGQQSEVQKQRRYVVVPSESVMLVIASQPDCPLKFDGAKLLLSADDNAWGASYELRNRGTKPIQTFSAVMWTSYGSGGTVGSRGRIGSNLIMPGETVNGGNDEIVPLTKELRDSLKLRGPMKAIVVLMIENIKFADGSSYDDKVTSQALLAYFSEPAGKVDRANRQK